MEREGSSSESDVASSEGFSDGYTETNPTYRLDGAEDKGSEPVEPEGLGNYRNEAQEYFDSYQRFLTTFAGDSSLKFSLSDAFLIDFDSGTVHVDTKWFFEQGYSKDQILWAALHELAHFRDFRKGPPEDMLANFDRMREQAKTTANWLRDKYQQTHGFLPTNSGEPTFPEAIQPADSFEQTAYKMHHKFYNVLDDIYVNNLVARRAAKYEADEAGGKEVTNLYREKLFPGTDYSELPRHLQFAYSLLRGEMVPDEEVKISEEIAAVLNQKIPFQGKLYTATEVIDTFLKPQAKENTQAKRRYEVIRKTLEPIYLELLKKDIADWQPPEPEEGQSGGSGEDTGGGSSEGGPQPKTNPFADEYERFDAANPDQFNEEAVNDWIEQAVEQDSQEAKPEAEEEIAVSAQEKLDRQWCEKHNITYKELERYREIENKVAPYLDELSQLWEHIIYGKTAGSGRALEGHYPTGTSLDINKVIQDWPQIQKGQFEDVRVMERMVEKESLVNRPELIRVRILGDNSGSMLEPDSKLETLQECAVLLLSSLREFDARLSLSRSKTKTKLSVETEFWTFGSRAKIAKPLSNAADNDQAAIIRSLRAITGYENSTNDFEALASIRQSLSEKELEDIQQKKTMEIVFEITDGGSANSAYARQEVNALQERGAVARAFQIGDVHKEEQKIFNYVWNNQRPAPLGFSVGSDVRNLIPATTASLKEFLGNVEL